MLNAVKNAPLNDKGVGRVIPNAPFRFY